MAKLQTPKALNRLELQRAKLFDELRAQGWPLDQWEEERQRQGLDGRQPVSAQPLTQPPERLGSTGGYLPLGFSEFLIHPAHGRPIRRCLAKNKYREDGQCGRFALKDCVYCKRHGGVLSRRVHNVPSHFLIHGRETRAVRRRRKEKNVELRELSKQAKALGMLQPGMRGPQFTKDGKIDSVAYLKRRERRLGVMAKKLMDI